jgi:hypothetical protein
MQSMKLAYPLAPALRADGVAKLAHHALAKQSGRSHSAPGVRRRELHFNAVREFPAQPFFTP